MIQNSLQYKGSNDKYEKMLPSRNSDSTMMFPVIKMPEPPSLHILYKLHNSCVGLKFSSAMCSQVAVLAILFGTTTPHRNVTGEDSTSGILTFVAGSHDEDGILTYCTGSTTNYHLKRICEEISSEKVPPRQAQGEIC